ncbi:HEAT repeat domain-containing protein [Bremerella sp.]|uniref:HEAT repeat domain-containing protein n=1 Tax=Bremerella sp. TaxID=2795602 RepID=UPI00391944CB
MWKRKIAILAVFFMGVGPAVFDAQGQTGDELAQARQRVAEFETPLVQQLLAAKNDNEIRDSEEFRSVIRDFFAGLDASATRVAATELLDSRYVYIVNSEFAAQLLGPLIRDADPVVRARAARAIGYNHCGAQYADELIAMLDGEPSADALVNVAYAMGGSGHQPFVIHLVKLLSHADAKVRSAALLELTRLSPKQAFDHNLRLLNDGQPSVRSAAIQNLAQYPVESSLMHVERKLNDEDPSVRERAVWVLGQMTSTRSADVIAKRLSDADHLVRGRAALVLGQLHATRHAHDVATLLKDEDVVVRRYATQAFGAMGEPRYIEDLRPLLGDADGQVRKYAAEAIRELEAVKTDGEPDDAREPPS